MGIWAPAFAQAILNFHQAHNGIEQAILTMRMMAASSIGDCVCGGFERRQWIAFPIEYAVGYAEGAVQ